MAPRLHVLPAHDQVSPRASAEQALVERSQTGDAEAFARLYERYRRVIFSACLRSLGNRTLAEDAVQDSFIRAYRHFDRFTPGRPLLPWLLTIARRRCSDIKRDARTVPRDPTDFEWSREANEDAADVVVRAERRRALERQLAALPPRQRRVLLLYALEGWKYSDIASAEGTSLLSIKSLIFRARTRLRHAVEMGALGLVAFPAAAWRRARARLAGIGARAPRTTMTGAAVTTTGQQMATGLIALALSVTGATGAAAGAVADKTLAQPGEAALKARPQETSIAKALSREGRAGAHWDAERASALLVGELTDPNGDVSRPEDTRIIALQHSPGFEEDGIVFAVGVPDCITACPPVLFRSDDAGATWTRVGAEGFDAEQILLPPGFPERDARIFAMGPLGLQVSTDGGASFDLAVPTARLLVGAAAISPAFHDGDPRIVIGAQALVQYDDALRAFVPSPSTALPGPLQPAFSPTYAEDGLMVIGGSRQTVRKNGAIFACTGTVCAETTVGGAIPKIRFAPDFEASRRVYAFTGDRLLVSEDAAATFRALEMPRPAGLLDLRMSKGALYAAVLGKASANGLFRSHDGGGSWARVDNPAFSSGAHVVASADRHLLVGLPSGVACSSDGGRTWAPRCAVA